MSTGRPGAPREFRIEDLAEATGATVRNIRVYQEKGLLPPPARRGRTAYYGPDHHRRLVLVLRLLDRGYTFATIEELFTAERVGITVTDLIEAENTRALRRPAVRRRPFSRADAEAVAGTTFSEEVVRGSVEVGIVDDGDADGGFLTDAHIYDLFRELIDLGLDGDDIDRVAATVFSAQTRSAEAMDVVVDRLHTRGITGDRAAERVEAILNRAGAAVRLIFQNAAHKRVVERLGLDRRADADPPAGVR